MDYLKIMQGMMFFVDDLTTDASSCLYTSEYTPTKKRVWIVLSNNKTNAFGSVITMAPVYTRDKITLPTHVMYNDGDVSRVICVDQLTAIPKNMIDLHGFVGMLTPETWFRVKQALNLYFSESYTVSELSTFTQTINAALQDINITKLVEDKICECVTQGLGTLVSKSPAGTGVTTVNTDNTFTTKDLVCSTSTNNAVTDSKVTKTRLTAERTPKKRGKRMSLEVSLDWYNDSYNMSFDDLREKYKEYGDLVDNAYLAKKRFAVKTRLEKAGIKV